jgi:hypothetical protein
MNAPPKASKIMVIRHAEKPTAQATGVKETGESSSHDLICARLAARWSLGLLIRAYPRPLAGPAARKAGIHFCLRRSGRP